MKTNNFIKIFIATILVTRIFLYFVPRTDIIYQDSFHHIYIGIILLILYPLAKFRPLRPFSLGLIVDEITSAPFYIADLIKMPLAKAQFWQYWSPYSIISTIIVTLITIVVIKKYRK
jgi:hypothetical protein